MSEYRFVAHRNNLQHLAWCWYQRHRTYRLIGAIGYTGVVS